MKNRLIIFILVILFYGCQNEETGMYDVAINKENILFEPIAGGAIMRYKLPAKRDIYAINVRYKDSRGIDVLKAAGYGSDSLLIDGFNEAQTNVRATVTLVNTSYDESKGIDVTFATKDSAPFAFFEKAEVMSSWGGFQVTYEADKYVSGMLHVLYLGINPRTKQEDTLLLKSFPITEGSETLLFPLQQKQDNYTVILRTEDNRGYRVKQKIWNNINAYTKRKLTADELEFIDPMNKSLEYEEEKTGVKYLFDGDIKGNQRMSAHLRNEVYTFIAGPSAVGAPFIIDMKEPKVPAGIRIFAMVQNSSLGFTNINAFTGVAQSILGPIWRAQYIDKLPCNVTLYGGNTPNVNDDSWVELGHFEQDPIATEGRWTTKCTLPKYDCGSMAALNAADSIFMEINTPATPTRYRYLKIIVNDVFCLWWQVGATRNEDKYVTMHELEIYVKED